METENKIIKYLIEMKKEMIIRELAKAIGADYKIVHTAVNRLIVKGVLDSKKIGKSIQVRFSGRLSKEVIEVEYERRKRMLQNKSISLLVDTIKEKIMTVNFILLLFGSYAKGNQNKNSDIDLMFIVNDKRIEKRIEEAISILPLKTHLLVFTEEQFVSMKNSRELNVVKEAIKNNVILYSIEQYYELINQ